MSAKRLKTNVPRKERPPIPSFGNAPEETTPQTPPTLPVPVPLPPSTDSLLTTSHWNKDSLLRVEAALQLHANAQKRGLAWRWLPLADVLRLVQKVSANFCLAPLGPTVDGSTDTVNGLAAQERLLYDLVCATSPTLYKLTRVMRSELPAWKYSERQEEQSDATMEWCLETVDFLNGKKSRSTEFHRLIAKSEMLKSKSDEILRILAAVMHRPDPNIQAAPSARTVDAKPAAVAFPESFLRPNMSIDERVRARANAKEEHRDRVEAAAAAKTAATGVRTQTDPIWLVRLADTLWYHSNHIFKRQADHVSASKPSGSSNSSSRNRNKTRNCVLTLKDVVDVLSRPSAATSNRVPTHAAQAERLTKREILAAVQELRDLVPNWIHFVGDSTDGSGQHQLSKDTTVWIKSVDYQYVRAFLTGQSNTGAAPPNVAMRPPSLLSTDRATGGSSSRPLNGGRPLVQPRPLNKRPLIATTTTTATTTSPAQADTLRPATVVTAGTTSSQDSVTTDPLFKMTRIERFQPEHDATTTTTTTTAAAASLSLKRSAPAEAPSTPPQKKKSRGLRINPNLILSEADYTGGEVIEPTLFESPRGLRSLFYQMNAGKRI